MQNIIRNATSADLPAIIEVDQQVVGDQTERSNEIIHAIQATNCRVLVSDSRVVAFGICRPRSFRGMDFLSLLVVDPKHRRKGIASDLLADFQNRSETIQCWTSTNASNSGMLSLLKKLKWINSDYTEDLDSGDPDLFFFSPSVKL